MGDERGSMLPAAAVLLLGSLLAMGLALDLGRWASTWREAAFAADAGAEAGAAMLDEGPAYRGMLLLDVGRAEAEAVRAALASRPRAGREVAARADPERVCVTVRQPFRPTLLQAAGVGTSLVEAAACAVPAQG